MENEMDYEKEYDTKSICKEAKSLYEFKLTESGPLQYGYRVGTNRDNKAVMELKPSGELVTLDPDGLREVLPPSIGLRFLPSDMGRVQHYLLGSLKEEDLPVGSLILVDGVGGAMAVVSYGANRKATKELPRCWIISTKFLDASKS